MVSKCEYFCHDTLLCREVILDTSNLYLGNPYLLDQKTTNFIMSDLIVKCINHEKYFLLFYLYLSKETVKKLARNFGKILYLSTLNNSQRKGLFHF